MAGRRSLWLLLASVALAPSSRAGAQSIEARAGRFFDSSDWITYRIGLRRPLLGVLGLQFHGDVLKSVNSEGGMAGVGTDLTAFRTGNQGPYLVAGLSGGLGSQTSSNLSNGWGSWSAGAGYDVFPASFLSVGLEGRWRGLSLGRREGLELGLGVTFHLGGSSPPARPQPGAYPVTGTPRPGESPLAEANSPLQSEPSNLADSIVVTAAAAMGRPYEYGGTGAGGGGFDCSGLIQHAYKQHGIV